MSKVMCTVCVFEVFDCINTDMMRISTMSHANAPDTEHTGQWPQVRPELLDCNTHTQFPCLDI